MSYDTTSPDYYGGEDDKNTLVFEGKTLYPVVDENTGKTTWYERRGTGLANIINDIKLGSITPPSKEFVPHEGAPLAGWWPDGFGDVFNKEQQKKFLDPKFQSQLRNKANEVITRENQDEKGQDATEAQTNANTLQKNNQGSLPPDSVSNTEAQDILNNITIKEKKGTRRSFGDLRYPIDMNEKQDVMKFTMLKYETKDLMEGGTFGFGNRDRVGPDGGARATGTVVLPIQSGIKDQNSADWGEDKADAGKIALAKAAIGGIEGGDATASAMARISSAVAGGKDDVKTAIKSIFAGKAAGVTGLIKRTKGATINPNLELLFNEPQLRPFNFTFKLSARSKKEAEEIVKIIRFFKQGMAPIRSESNLFLLAPHTFQIHYLLRGQGEHPFIGKMKECALTSMNTDYTPDNNYSTTRDGVMTSYTITMEFKELEPVFNDDYENEEVVNQLTPEIGPPVPGGISSTDPSLEIGF